MKINSYTHSLMLLQHAAIALIMLYRQTIRGLNNEPPAFSSYPHRVDSRPRGQPPPSGDFSQFLTSASVWRAVGLAD